MTETRNPYLVALAVTTAVLAGISIILFVIGAGQSRSLFDSEAATPTFAAAGLWLTAALGSFIVTLAAGAITWRLSTPMPVHARVYEREDESATSPSNSESFEEGQRAAE